MVKKIISVILCMALSVGLLCGCNLFVHNLERDYQRVIVEIPAVEYSYTYSSENDASVDKGIPCYEYNGRTYYLGSGKVYYKDVPQGNGFKNADSYSLFANAAGNIELYYFADDLVDSGVISEADLKEIKDVLVSGGDETHKVEYMSYNVTLPERKIYKTELANYINNYLSTYVNSLNYSVEDTVNLLLDAIIVSRGLMINESWKFFISGKIPFTQADVNYIEQSVYESIDSELRTLQETILEEKDLDVPDYDAEDTDGTDSETTYPVAPEENSDAEVEDNYNEKPWSIADEENMNRWPGKVGDDERISLELEAMRRLLIQYENNIDADFRMTDEQKARAKKDIEDLREIQNTQGIEYVYSKIGTTFIADYFYRSDILNSYVTSKVESYIKDELSGYVTVTPEEIQDAYEDNLKNQKQSYDENISNYDTAIDNGDSIYYHPDPKRYFFVKHILVQFSDEQKKHLEEFNRNPNYTVEEQTAERNRLAEEIKIYAHKDGEDDTSRAYSVKEVFNEINAAVSKYSANPLLAVKEFDKLIYKYNQDPGSFSKTGGYAVKTVDNGDDQWVAEFAKAARELDAAGKVGALYAEPIVTDYGVHFMIYLGRFDKSVMAPSDYVDLIRSETFEEKIRNDIFTAKTNNEYTKWQQQNVYKMLDDESVVKIYKDVFKDFYELD